MSEAHEQAHFFSAIAQIQEMYPHLSDALDWVHCSLNGVFAVNKGVAAKWKAQGMTKGIFDIFWPYNNGKFPGMYLDAKYGKNRLSKDQKQFKKFVESQGYYADTFYYWQEGIWKLCRYAAVKPPLYIQQIVKELKK